MPKRDVTDPMDRWWTIDQAADHLGVRVATIRKYIREGLPLHFTLIGMDLLDRDELLTEYRRRQESTRATRRKSAAA